MGKNPKQEKKKYFKLYLQYYLKEKYKYSVFSGLARSLFLSLTHSPRVHIHDTDHLSQKS